MKFPEELGIPFLTEAECTVNNPFLKRGHCYLRKQWSHNCVRLWTCKINQMLGATSGSKLNLP